MQQIFRCFTSLKALYLLSYNTISDFVSTFSHDVIMYIRMLKIATLRL